MLKRIKELREDKDYKQKEIAQILKVHLTQYQRWENGYSNIPNEKLKILCLFYGVSADYILELPKGLNYPERWGMKNENWI